MNEVPSTGMREEFAATAAALPDPFRLWLRESCGSTNDEARTLGETGSPGGSIVVANSQMAGRGRRGTAWFGEPRDSLAFSILWRPQAAKSLWPRLALATGLAVAEACETSVPLVGIKWPNDVWIAGRKVAGILVEAGSDFVVAGVGINVNSTGFPDEIAATATSLALECGRPVDRAALLAGVVSRFARHAARVDAGFDEVITAVRKRCVLIGGEVAMRTQTGEEMRGHCDGVGPSGELLVRTTHGLQRILQADEVRPVKRCDVIG